MITFGNEMAEEHFGAVCQFAWATKQIAQFEETLERWGAKSDDKELRLFKDFAPYSFVFELYEKKDGGELGYLCCGGIIYHGDHDGGGNGSAPTFSVCLEPTQGWAVHT
jgi:hypothetical protein